MKPYYEDAFATLYHGDSRELLAHVSPGVAGVVTSPPYNQGDMSGGYANLSGGYETYDDQR